MAGVVLAEFENILLDNWSHWADGGVEWQQLSDKTKQDIASTVEAWATNAGVTETMPDGRAALDLATWCVHGTDTLPLLPPDIRQKRILERAKIFGVSPDSLTKLIVQRSAISGDR